MKLAAEHHLMVDYHGAYKPTGIERDLPEPPHAGRRAGQRVQQVERPRHADAQGHAALHAHAQPGRWTSRREDFGTRP